MTTIFVKEKPSRDSLKAMRIVNYFFVEERQGHQLLIQFWYNKKENCDKRTKVIFYFKGIQRC